MRTLADILKKATQLHQAGKLEQAARGYRGYRRILKIDPRNEDTLHRYGQLLARKGDHGAAKRMFELLTLVRTDSYKPWLLLGQSCEALGQFLDAANAYREVVRCSLPFPAFSARSRTSRSRPDVSKMHIRPSWLASKS
ncbi:hypothetical protein [Nitrobacter sp. JJSN]|uniref:hypothetical protein n=1 Tax=Nitrobacter sp. JJSN TaxID=3453033 RepID=UPI003F75DD8C